MLDVGDTGADVRDAAQVSATARWLADSDAAGGLDATVLAALSPRGRGRRVAEEGWVLGVMP